MARSPINERLTRAVAHHQAGKLAEAERLYDQVLALDRNNPDALNLKGIIANTQGRHEEARALFQRTIAALPKFPDAHFNLAMALAALGRTEDALESYMRALAVKPGYADARLNAGLLLYTTGRTAEALAMFRRMTQEAPHDARGFYNLGVGLEQSLPKTPASERAAVTEDARAAFARALALDPNNADIHYALANLHTFAGEYRAAIERLEVALALKPGWSSAFNNLGSQYEAVGERAAALAAFDRAIASDPNDAAAVVNRGMTYLCMGRLAEGWDGYARRFEDPRFPFVKRDWPWRPWLGEELAGKSILVWSDQGVGDEVLYSSMLREIAARAATCVVECTPRLVPLYRRSFPGLEIIANSPEGRRDLLKRAFDYHSSVLDLGRWLRPRLAAFPNQGRILIPAPERVAQLREKYRSLSRGGLLVGISWRSVTPEMSHQKGQPLSALLPLLKSQKLTFINIQYGNVQAELDAFHRDQGIKIHVDSEIDSLADLDGFAAQVAALDAVVTISNTAAHIAGALGVPTYLCLPRGNKQLWYWFAEGGYSPWYRSIRILRDRPDAIFAEIKAVLELQALLAHSRSVRAGGPPPVL